MLRGDSLLSVHVYNIAKIFSLFVSNLFTKSLYKSSHKVFAGSREFLHYRLREKNEDNRNT